MSEKRPKTNIIICYDVVEWFLIGCWAILIIRSQLQREQTSARDFWSESRACFERGKIEQTKSNISYLRLNQLYVVFLVICSLFVSSWISLVAKAYIVPWK